MAQQFTQKMANDLAAQLASALGCMVESAKAEADSGLILGHQTLLDIESAERLLSEYEFFKAQLPDE